MTLLLNPTLQRADPHTGYVRELNLSFKVRLNYQSLIADGKRSREESYGIISSGSEYLGYTHRTHRTDH